MLKVSGAAMLLALLSACAATQGPQPLPAPAPTAQTDAAWTRIVSPADRQLIETLTERWRAVLRAVPQRQKALVARQGMLLLPDAARERPQPPPGSYDCRLVKLGSEPGVAAAVRSFPDFFCNIRAESDDRLSFTKQTGSELPGGWLYEDGSRRLVLTGARQREPGDNSLAYGAAPDRDVVGVIERIGPFRWRLVIPWREGQQGLDIYELTPVPLERQAVEPPTGD